MRLGEGAVGDQRPTVPNADGGGGAFRLQRMPGEEDAAAALVGEGVHPGTRIGETRIALFGPFTVVDQQHVLHRSLLSPVKNRL